MNFLDLTSSTTWDGDRGYKTNFLSLWVKVVTFRPNITDLNKKNKNKEVNNQTSFIITNIPKTREN